MPANEPTLFETSEPFPWDEDEPLFASVVFNRPLQAPFSYFVPPALVDAVAIGKRVLVPFGRGNSQVVGYCVGLSEKLPEGVPREHIKSLLAVIDEQTLLAPSMLDLTRWMADYYCCTWGQVLETVLPAPVRKGVGRRLATVVEAVPTADWPKSALLTAKQQQAAGILAASGVALAIPDLCQRANCGPGVVKALLAKGILRQRQEQRVRGALDISPDQRVPKLPLNPAQQAASDVVCQAVRAGRGGTFLLHGVTGSGKTEVYLEIIEEATQRGRQAIVLVPEISLTPQTITRFRRRFRNLAILHSHQADGERHAHWQRIAAGDVEVVIGARSAVFAPCPSLGVIVVDEEHENSFKQDTVPRYHARDVACYRARLEQVPVVLGSATPSLESWSEATEGKWGLLSLPKRVADRPMPKVQLIDLRDEYRSNRGGFRSISRPLETAIRDTTATGGQVILLLNRRGFAPTLLCPNCGHVKQCDHCEVSLTFHKARNRLLCHQCDTDYEIPERCGKCKMPTIRYSGVGTERLEEEVRASFPELRIARMDSDVMRGANSYENVLSRFRDRQIDLLLGTQMIAKGLDFPNVHLVGVVTADIGRNLPDFRASERIFQLIAQVAGRTGRGDTLGKVLVQTYAPHDPCIQAAARHDYLAFVNHELPMRREFGYPPNTRLLRVIVRSKDLPTAEAAADALAERFLAAAAHLNLKVRLLGPAPAPLGKLRDYYRFHFQVHAPDSAEPLDARHQVATAALAEWDCPHDVEIALDIDPAQLL